jgi:hypothetical protein
MNEQFLCVACVESYGLCTKPMLLNFELEFEIPITSASIICKSLP